MPRNLTFKELPEGTIFLSEDAQSDLVLYLKYGEYGAPYNRYNGSRHGALGFYPARKHRKFSPDELIYRLAYEDECD